jgi:hypothetical protein
MFEIGIFSVIVLAVSYWAVLWVMGRREDVLHGEFVKADAQPGEPRRAVTPEPSVRPVFPEPAALPERPVFPQRTSFPERQAVPERPSLTERPVQTALSARPAERISLPKRRVQAVVPEQPAFRPERLEQLLAPIKQDLNQLVQK